MTNHSGNRKEVKRHFQREKLIGRKDRTRS